MIVIKKKYKFFDFQLIGLHRLTILLFVLIVSPNILAVDTDGDGIDDAIDLDSDNDGILNRDEGVICTYPNVSSSAGHNVVDGTESYGSGCTSGLGGTSQWSNGFYSENDKNKTFYAYWNISVKPGVPFTITATVSSVNAHWKNNGVSSGTFRILNQPNSSLVVTNYGNNFSGITRTETFIPTSNNVRVQFDFRMKRTNFNCDGYNLPEISLRFSFKKQVWTTCSSYDFDQDGIPNYLDLDSDNDGISDLIESGADYVALDPDNNGVIDGTQFVDNDNDGLADVIESTNGDNKGIKVIETDGDGNANFLDFDSDGDGIPDAIESQLTATYVVNYSNDGDVTDDDGDGDGVLDVYDGVSGHGGDFNSPQNTDGTDNPDYLDLDSDNDSKADILEGGNIVKNVKYEDPDGSINNPMIDLPNETGDNKEVAYREVCIKPTLTITSPHCMSDGTSKFTALPGGGTWSGPGVSADGVFDPNSAGSGTHTISYSLGGTCVDSASILVNELPDFSVTKTDVTCVKLAEIVVEGVSGLAPYVYSIDGGVNYQTTNLFTDVGVGIYNLVLKDSNGCTNSKTDTIVAIPPFDVDNIISADATCFAMGFIHINTSGGTNPIEYSIDGGQNFFLKDTFNNLIPGTYNIVIKDANSCEYSETRIISDPIPAKVDSIIVVNDSCSSCQGEITIFATGPNKLNYSIDNGITNQDSNKFSNLCEDNYDILISVGTCNTLNKITIKDVGSIADATINPLDSICIKKAPFKLTAKTQGGVWSGDGVDPLTGIFNPKLVGPGTHTVFYTIGGACGDKDSVIIHVVKDKVPEIFGSGTLCVNADTVQLFSNIDGGIWNGNGIVDSILGIFDPKLSGLGNHQIKYQLQGVCQELATMNIVVESPLNIKLVKPIIPKCLFNDSINLTLKLEGVDRDKITWYFGDSTEYVFDKEEVIHIFKGYKTFHGWVMVEDTICAQDTIINFSIELKPASVFNANAAITNSPIKCSPYDAIFKGTDGASYHFWSFGDSSYSNAGNPSHFYKTTGKFKVIYIATNPNYCISRDTLELEVEVLRNKPLLNKASLVAPEPCSYENRNLPIKINYYGESTDSLLIDWGDGSTPIYIGKGNIYHNHQYIYTKEGNYLIKITAFDKYCGEDSTITIPITHQRLVSDDAIMAPNIITPNEDGINDQFKLFYHNRKDYNIYKDILDYEVHIFNRWGKKLYQFDRRNLKEDISELHWSGNLKNGEKVPEGIYFYMVSYRVKCYGDGDKYRIRRLKGHLTIQR